MRSFFRSLSSVWSERLTHNQRVGGSSPSGTTTEHTGCLVKWVNTTRVKPRLQIGIGTVGVTVDCNIP